MNMENTLRVGEAERNKIEYARALVALGNRVGDFVPELDNFLLIAKLANLAGIDSETTTTSCLTCRYWRDPAPEADGRSTGACGLHSRSHWRYSQVSAKIDGKYPDAFEFVTRSDFVCGSWIKK